MNRLSSLGLLTAPVDDFFYNNVSVLLAPEVKRMGNAITGKVIDSVYAPLIVAHDQNVRDQVKTLADYHRSKNPVLMVVLGMGGSHLGIYAIYQALIASGLHKAYMPIHFVDTLDINYVSSVLDKMKAVLSAGQRILLVIITKSGTTTETIVNAHLFISTLRVYRDDAYNDQIVMITDEDSPLYAVGKQESIAVLTIPKMVGGRYSVFSAVGLFPLACLGISIEDFHAGARDAYNIFDNNDDCAQLALLRAITIAFYYTEKDVRIHDIFVWSPFLSGFAQWYRQLVAESLGKKAINGSGTLMGITPTVSIGPADLHSVVQLYLGGVRDKITTFVSVAHVNTQIEIPWYAPLAECVADLQGKSYAKVASAIRKGTLQAYCNDKRPYMEIILPELSVRALGYVMQMLMVEVIYLGYIWEVNPYDQPQVESYKKVTRSLLHTT